MQKLIQRIILGLVFVYPLVYLTGFAYPGIFPRAVFTFFVCEAALFLFLWYSFSEGKVIVKKSYLTVALLFYVGALFISAIFGPDFLQSFWSSYFRMTGLVTWLHYLGLILVIPAVFTTEEDWRKVFRTILLSGSILALVSWLGADGLNLKPFSLIKEGGSLFGNTSYSGAYYLLAFFISLVGLFLETNKKWRVTYIFLLILIFFNPDLFNFQTFLGVARASALSLWGGTFTLIVLFLIHKFTNRKYTKIAASLIVALILIVYSVNFVLVLNHQGKVYNTYLNEPGTARLLAWDIAFEGIKDRPILGYGAENFNYAFQEHLNPEVINKEAGTEWFDNAHNFTLSQAIEGGILGAVILLALFFLILVKSSMLYMEKGTFQFLIIPFIFLFHFLQMQTFFQTDSALFLIFILLGFLLSYEKNYELKIAAFLTSAWGKGVLVILLCICAYVFVNIPVRENLLVANISHTQNRTERLKLYEGLCCLKIYPSGALSLLATPFQDGTTANRDMLRKDEALLQNVKEEYEIYINLYDKYLPRYNNNYRYLIEHANLINTAFIFGVNELEQGEEIANKALAISKSYPHAYWALAVNLYQQGRKEEGIAYAKKAVELDPTIEKSQLLYKEMNSRSR